MLSLATFPTAIGICGIVWAETGIVGATLPAGDAARTRARLRRRVADAQETEPEIPIAAVIDRMTALLAGARIDLSDVAIDLDGQSPFNRAVYEAARAIPHGTCLTYGELAARIGHPTAAREVGTALGQNPIPIIVPCHRIVAAGGRSGGFSAPGGAATKLRMLAIEGAAPGGQPGLFDAFPA